MTSVSANAPVDIGKEDIKQYQKPVEDSLNTFQMRQSGKAVPKSGDYSLFNLIQKMDSSEPLALSDVERSVYLTVRESLQLLSATYAKLAKGLDIDAIYARTPNAELENSPELRGPIEFANNFATFVASSFAKKRLEDILVAKGVHIGEDNKVDEGTNDNAKTCFQPNQDNVYFEKTLVHPIFRRLQGS